MRRLFWLRVILLLMILVSMSPNSCSGMCVKKYMSPISPVVTPVPSPNFYLQVLHIKLGPPVISLRPACPNALKSALLLLLQ